MEIIKTVISPITATAVGGCEGGQACERPLLQGDKGFWGLVEEDSKGLTRASGARILVRVRVGAPPVSRS